MGIIVVWPYELKVPNRARYQRIKTLSENFDVFLVTMMLDKIDPIIYKKLKRVISIRTVNILSYLLYPFLLAYAVLLMNKKYKDVTVYVFYNWTIIIVMAICYIFGIKTFVDFLDDPNLMEQVYKIKKGSKLKYVVYKIINYTFKRFAINGKQIIGYCSIGVGENSTLPKLYSKRYKIKPNKMIIVPNGSDLSITYPKIERKFRNELQIIYVTYIGQQREVDVLINLLTKIKDYNFKLILIGGTLTKYDKKWILETAKKYNWINYLGEIPHSQVLKMIDKSDVGIFMGTKEVTNYRFTHPIKIAEYLAMGIPVIAPRYEGVLDMINEGYNGFLFDPENPKEIITLLNDNKTSLLNNKYKNNALNSIKNFDWGIINKSFINHFKNL